MVDCCCRWTHQPLATADLPTIAGHADLPALPVPSSRYHPRHPLSVVAGRVDLPRLLLETVTARWPRLSPHENLQIRQGHTVGASDPVVAAPATAPCHGCSRSEHGGTRSTASLPACTITLPSLRHARCRAAFPVSKAELHRGMARCHPGSPLDFPTACSGGDEVEGRGEECGGGW